MFTEITSNELLYKYRNVFNSAQGRLVLKHMLVDLRFIDDRITITEGEKALKAYATRLLKIIGGLRFDDAAMNGLLNGLCAQKLPEREVEND